MKKAILPIFWILAVISIFKLADSFHRKSEHFFGIADDREQNISFQYPVEIIQALAVEGEDVQQGMPILEVKRHDLISNLATLDEQIRKLELEKKEAHNTITSQIESLTAKKQTVLADIDHQVHALELKLAQRQQLVASISGQTHALTAAAPEAVEIADLNKKRHYSAQTIQAEIDNLKSQLNSKSRPVDAQIAELKSNQAELQRQNKGLKVAAQINGRIGSILYKPGDLVAAFQPIMTVHSSTPRSVKGYIHENILNEVQIGQTVWVKSLTLNQEAPPLEGVVESLGNRIVEYPERIKKDPLVSAWGREVVVRLNSGNTLLFGEKVDISLSKQEPAFAWLTLINKAVADFKDSHKADNHHSELQSIDSKIDMKTIEASALLWNPDAKHYLLLSDEAHDDKAGVFILNQELAVTGMLNFQDDTSIDDLESISKDGRFIYVSSSLSYNKKDKLKAKRRKLLRFTYQGDKVEKQQEIDLFDVLTEIKDNSNHTPLADFLIQAMDDHSIDIESHAVRDNALYLGFKTPLLQGAAVIVKIANLDAVFDGKKTTGEIWQTIALKDPNTGEPTQLSDMFFLEDQLMLLSGTIQHGVKSSHLWRYNLKDSKLTNVKQFSGVIAEGLAYRADQQSFVVVFDEGSDAISKYQTITLSGTAQ